MKPEGILCSKMPFLGWKLHTFITLYGHKKKATGRKNIEQKISSISTMEVFNFIPITYF